MLRECRAATRIIRSNSLLFGSLVVTSWLPGALLIALAGSNEEASSQAEALAHLFVPIATGAVLYAASSSTRGAPTYRSALVAGLRLWPRLLVARFLANFIIAIGALALVIPGIVLTVRYSLVEVAVVVESAGVNESRNRSMRLTRGIAWRLTGATLGFWLVMLALAYSVQLSTATSAMVISFLVTCTWAVLAVLFYVFYSEARAIEDAAAERPSSPRPASFSRRLAYAAAVLIVFSLAFVPAFRAAVVSLYDIGNSSMKPNILPGDRVLVDKTAYDFRLPFDGPRLLERRDPDRGDVILFRSPDDGKLLTKRIVGLPNETIELRGNRLFIDRVLATFGDVVEPGVEAHASSPSLAIESIGDRSYLVAIDANAGSMAFGPVRIPESCYFVLGDNRSNSRDSRFFGPVEREAIRGRATKVVLSVDPEANFRPRWDRFFLPL